MAAKPSLPHEFDPTHVSDEEWQDIAAQMTAGFRRAAAELVKERASDPEFADKVRRMLEGFAAGCRDLGYPAAADALNLENFPD